MTTDTRCTRTRKDGSPCEAARIDACDCEDHHCCYFHCETPAVVERRKAAYRKSGERTREAALRDLPFETWPAAPGRRAIREDLYRVIAAHLNDLNARSNASPDATAELVATYDILRRLGLTEGDITRLAEQAAIGL